MDFKLQQFQILFYVASTCFIFLAWNVSVGVKANFYWSIKNEPEHTNECMRIVEEEWANDEKTQLHLCKFHNIKNPYSLGITGYHNVSKTSHYIKVLKCGNKDDVYDRTYFFPRRGTQKFIVLYPCKYNTEAEEMMFESICTYADTDRFDKSESPKKKYNPFKSLKAVGFILKRSLPGSNRNSQHSVDKSPSRQTGAKKSKIYPFL